MRYFVPELEPLVLLEPDGEVLGEDDGDEVEPEVEPDVELPLEGDVVDGDAAGERSLDEPARGVVSRPVSLHAARPAISARAQNPCSTFFIAIPPLAVFRRGGMRATRVPDTSLDTTWTESLSSGSLYTRARPRRVSAPHGCACTKESRV